MINSSLLVLLPSQQPQELLLLVSPPQLALSITNSEIAKGPPPQLTDVYIADKD
jgi:hypothetical protein